MFFVFKNDFEWSWVLVTAAGLTLCLLNLRLSRWMAWASLGIGVVFLLRLQLLYIALARQAGWEIRPEAPGFANYYWELVAPVAWAVFFIGLAGGLFDVRSRLSSFAAVVRTKNESAPEPDSVSDEIPD